MELLLPDLIFVGVWGFIGSVLGFFAFTNSPDRTPLNRFGRCCLSVGIGLFVSFPLYIYLVENAVFSKMLSILVSGLGAFCLPDFLVKYWPKLLYSFANRFIDKTVDRCDKACLNDDEER